MRTLTIILILAVFVTLGALSAEAKESVCKANVSNTHCNPSVIVMPKVKSPRSFKIVDRQNKALRLIFKIQDMYSGNATEIRSPQPFKCNFMWTKYQDERGLDLIEYEVEAFLASKDEKPSYGDAPTPKGWYSCQVSMHGRGHYQSDFWDYQIRPSTSQQLFVVEGYWNEED